MSIQKKVPVSRGYYYFTQEDPVLRAGNMVGARQSLSWPPWSLGQWLKEVVFVKHLAQRLALGTQCVMAFTTIMNECQTPYRISSTPLLRQVRSSVPPVKNKAQRRRAGLREDAISLLWCWSFLAPAAAMSLCSASCLPESLPSHQQQFLEGEG